MSAGHEVVRGHFDAILSVTTRVRDELGAEVAGLAERAIETIRAGRKLIFCGNGGSAADAQHLATEYVIRFQRKRGALPALALTTDTSLLTAGANDFGFETVFERQVEALGQEGDLLILHSTSGNSENLMRAIHAAKARGIHTVAVLAKGGGRMLDVADSAIVVPTDSTARAQEMHLAIGHIVCDLVDRAMAGED